MKSKIIKVNSKNLIEIIIDGSKIEKWEDYIKIIGEELDFPECDRYPTYDGYSDWMRDLSWIDRSLIIIKIKNYKEFMIKNLKEKEIFLRIAERIVEEWNDLDIRQNSECKTIIFCLVD